jgi:hypothetical protein
VRSQVLPLLLESTGCEDARTLSLRCIHVEARLSRLKAIVTDFPEVKVNDPT